MSQDGELAATRGSKVRQKCKCCGKEFEARAADVKRGWAKFCSKSCKAKEQEKRTGQYRQIREAADSDGSNFDNTEHQDRQWNEPGPVSFWHSD